MHDLGGGIHDRALPKTTYLKAAKCDPNWIASTIFEKIFVRFTKKDKTYKKHFVGYLHGRVNVIVNFSNKSNKIYFAIRIVIYSGNSSYDLQML